MRSVVDSSTIKLCNILSTTSLRYYRNLNEVYTLIISQQIIYLERSFLYGITNS